MRGDGRKKRKGNNGPYEIRIARVDTVVEAAFGCNGRDKEEADKRER